MSRDQNKNREYFLKYLGEQDKRIKRFTEVLHSLEDQKPEKAVQCKHMLVNMLKDAISASYSVGETYEQISVRISKYLSTLNEVKITDYREMIDALAFGILFPNHNLENIMQTEMFDDALVCQMKDYILKGTYSKQDAIVKFPEQYQVFYKYLNGDICVAEFLEYMENKWYDTCKESAFYDTHKNANEVYVGYWCWVAAAVLKMTSQQSCHSKYIPSEVIR